jgi:S1-C subfamily serine protease
MLFALSLALAIGPLDDPPALTAPADIVSALETAMTNAIAKAQPSVVAIARERHGDGDETTAIKGRNRAPAEELQPPGRLIPGEVNPNEIALPGDFGAGVVIGDKGEILTVYHIVRGASRIRVRAFGQPQFEAEILAADPRTDLAVIVPRSTLSGRLPKLTPIKIGDTTKLRQGTFLVALGNPFNVANDGRASASWGILSNTARRCERSVFDPLSTALFRYQPTLLQLDAKLNLGMSGGAVVNLRGELVGITTSAGSPAGFDAQAGYAIPMDALALRALEILKQGKEVEYAFIGVQLDNEEPSRIASVAAGTPAAQGHLIVGDKFVEVNGVPVIGKDGLSVTLALAPVGEPVKLKVLRDGEIVQTTVKTSKYPYTVADSIASDRPRPWKGLRVDYASMLLVGSDGNPPLPGQTMIALAKGGVAVMEVETGSPADLSGIKKGEVITTVGGKPVSTPTEFARVVGELKGPTVLKTDGREVTIP